MRPEGKVPDPISPFKKKKNNNNNTKQLLEQAGGASYVPGAENELPAFKSNWFFRETCQEHWFSKWFHSQVLGNNIGS